MPGHSVQFRITPLDDEIPTFHHPPAVLSPAKQMATEAFVKSALENGYIRN